MYSELNTLDYCVVLFTTTCGISTEYGIGTTDERRFNWNRFFLCSRHWRVFIDHNVFVKMLICSERGRPRTQRCKNRVANCANAVSRPRGNLANKLHVSDIGVIFAGPPLQQSPKTLQLRHWPNADEFPPSASFTGLQNTATVAVVAFTWKWRHWSEYYSRITFDRMVHSERAKRIARKQTELVSRRTDHTVWLKMYCINILYDDISYIIIILIFFFGLLIYALILLILYTSAEFRSDCLGGH